MLYRLRVLFTLIILSMARLDFMAAWYGQVCDWNDNRAKHQKHMFAT